MANASEKPLPKYAAPPVVETVLGVEFAQLEKWGIPYFGVLWGRIKDQFPKFEVKFPLASQIEDFGKPKLPTQTPAVQFMTEPDVRCWFIGGDDRTLIQVQRNRFTHNWRKTGPADAYPHYDGSVRPAFQRAWRVFLDFVNEYQLGDVSVLQCEVTYINHLDVGQVLNSACGLQEVFPCWSGKTSGSFLPAPENVGFDVTYQMPNHEGRLRVSMKPAIRNQDGQEILQLTLTARGKPKGSDADSVLAWLDKGREWVVRGFTDFTSEKMHRLWRRST